MLIKNDKQNSIVFKRDTLHEKIYEAIESLFITDDLRYYVSFLSSIRIFKDNTKPTAYVTLKNGHIVMGYNSDFIDSLEIPEIKFLLIHELYHINFNHLHRSIYMEDKELCNIAQDMIINTLINRHHENVMKMPEKGLTLPEEYEGELIFELLYYWLQKQKDQYDEWKERNKDLFPGENKSDSDEDGKPDSSNDNNGGNSKKDDENESSGAKPNNPNDPCPTSDKLRNIFDSTGKGEQLTLDSHDEINDLSTDELDVMKQTVETIKQKNKRRGLLQGNLEEILNLKLRRPKKNNLKLIKTKVLGMFKGFIRRNTYKKYNKKLNYSSDLTFKGVTKETRFLNVVLDTSGSMMGDFEDVLTQIFTKDYQMQMVQCDTNVRKVHPIKNKNELNKLAIKGMGGTYIQPAIDYISNPLNKINRYPTVILTDGYTDRLNVDKLVEVLILSTEIECPIDGTKIPRQVIIKNQKGI